MKAPQTSGFKADLRDKMRLWVQVQTPSEPGPHKHKASSQQTLGLDYLAPGKPSVGWVPAHTGALYRLNEII